jgi:very-short-patch-repair endonuclease/ribosomal protein L40E
MESGVLSTLICAASLMMFAVVLIVVVVRLLSRPGSPVQPLSGSQSAQSSRLPRRPPSLPLLRSTPGTPNTPLLGNLPYRRIPHLLSAAEAEFFNVLRSATPVDLHIFAQVRLANLVEVQHWARRDKTNWYRIQAKCVDFVLCEVRDFAPRLVIELDDRSHDRLDRRKRDAFVDEVLASAGIPIVHIRWQRSYDPQALAGQIATALGCAPLVPAPLPSPAVSNAPVPAPAFWSPIAVEAAYAPTPPPSAHQITTMRRICGQCQAELSDRAKFCSQCGAVFSAIH